MTADMENDLKRHEIPGRVMFLEGKGDLPLLEVRTPWSKAEIYMHGATITSFQKLGDQPMLFTSQFSRFTTDHPIRGGIPVIFPWFGSREGLPTHGFARISPWTLGEVNVDADGAVSLQFGLSEAANSATWPPFQVNYVVKISDKLTLELMVTNASSREDLVFENCLHSYFDVADVRSISVTGLKGIGYLDKVEGAFQQSDSQPAIKIASEVDRVYFDATGVAEIVDPTYRRTIRIEMSGARSTVVWNPWISKSQQMPDFGNEEYLKMVCVESGNVGKNQVSLPPGRSASMRVVLSTQAI